MGKVTPLDASDLRWEMPLARRTAACVCGHPVAALTFRALTEALADHIELTHCTLPPVPEETP